MDKKDIVKLDALFQQVLLKDNPASMLGGKATLVHHFVTKAQGLATRWYKPNGIPLTQEQHNKIHGSERTSLEKAIILIKGQNWRNDLRRRAVKIVKDLTYREVEDYLLGYSEKYA